MSSDQKTILVVDDDYDIRTSLGAVLEDEGYEVVLAENGSAGMKVLLAGLRPKLIFLDLMMPVMDGFEFSKLWKADPSLREIAVVIISADGTTDRKASACGATGWIRKPIKLDQLLGVAEQYAA